MNIHILQSIKTNQTEEILVRLTASVLRKSFVILIASMQVVRSELSLCHVLKSPIYCYAFLLCFELRNWITKRAHRTFSRFNYVIYARFGNEDEHHLPKQRQHLCCGFSSNFIHPWSLHQKRKMVFKSNQHFFVDLGKQQLAFFSLSFGRWCKDINTFFRFSFSPMMEIWWKHHKWLFCLNRKRSNHHFKYLSERLKQDL